MNKLGIVILSAGVGGAVGFLLIMLKLLFYPIMTEGIGFLQALTPLAGAADFFSVLLIIFLLVIGYCIAILPEVMKA